MFGAVRRADDASSGLQSLSAGHHTVLIPFAGAAGEVTSASHCIYLVLAMIHCALLCRRECVGGVMPAQCPDAAAMFPTSPSL